MTPEQNIAFLNIYKDRIIKNIYHGGYAYIEFNHPNEITLLRGKQFIRYIYIHENFLFQDNFIDVTNPYVDEGETIKYTIPLPL